MSLCPVVEVERVGKGQRREATTAKPGTGAQLWLGKKGGNRELGDSGCGCQSGQRLPLSCKSATPGFMGRSGVETGLRPEEWALGDKESQ